MLRGSPLYMAPEMVCQRQYDARVDLWSVGVILYGESSVLCPHPAFYTVCPQARALWPLLKGCSMMAGCIALGLL